MPRSKRNKQVELAKTKKRGLEWKKRLHEEVRSCVDTYGNVFVFTVNDMRNSKMKNVREQWKHSRFFIGKNKIMAMALGRFDEEAYKPNLHKLGQQIKGQRGLLFTNKPVEEVLSWFRSYSEGDYARSGNIATETIYLSAGPLTMFPHNLEPYLRELGLPTSLEKGVIHLIKDHEVCKEGDVLTPETAKIIKLLGYEMAEFHITIDCVWSQDGSFMQFTDSIDTGKENAKKGKKTSFGKKPTDKSLNSQNVEEMEVEENDSNDSEGENNNSPVKSAINESNGVKEDNALEVQDSSDGDIVESYSVEITSASKTTGKSSNINVSTTMDETTNIRKSVEGSKNVSFGTEDEKVLIDSKRESINLIKENKSPSLKNQSSTPRSIKKKKKKSLPKTPDADTSQESPVFRQLRNRSVKFSAKKKK